MPRVKKTNEECLKNHPKAQIRLFWRQLKVMSSINAKCIPTIGPITQPRSNYIIKYNKQEKSKKTKTTYLSSVISLSSNAVLTSEGDESSMICFGIHHSDPIK